MESVAWVEVLGHRGQVLHRHPAFAWPVRIGNNYDGDIVIDDPAFPEIKIFLETNADKETEVFFELATGKSNGGAVSRLRINGKHFETTTPKSTQLLSDDVIECGSTRIRVRLRGHDPSCLGSIDTERFIGSWTFAWLIAITAAIWYGFFSSINSLDEEVSAQLKEPLLFVIALLIWWGGWTFTTRLATGYGHAREHLLITGILFALFSNAGSAGSVVAFATGTSAFAIGGQLVQLVAVFNAMFAHLRLVKPVSETMSVLRAGLLPCIAWLWLMNGINIAFPEDQKPMSYDASMWPASIVLTSNETSQDILASLDSVKERVDKTAKSIEIRVNEGQ
jgi:hypothetical protein